MSRTLSILTLVLSVLGGIALIWYLAYGIDGEPPPHVAVTDLMAPVRIGWQAEGVIHIDAEGESDAYAALGFAQAYHRPWTLLYLRQAALGRLGEWFGPAALTPDSLTRRLGIAPLSRKAMDHLQPDERRLLAAFGQGINAALATDAVRHAERLVLLDITPEPWEPWHTLAVERLIAWLATESGEEPGTIRPSRATQRFRKQDRALHRALGLNGFEHGVAWSGRDDNGPFLVQRHVYGSTARPLFLDIVLTIRERTTISGGVLLGTPFFPAGRSGEHAWAVLLYSDSRMLPSFPDSLAPRPHFERLLSKDGSEMLLNIRRDSTKLILGEARPQAILWAGFAPRSDFGSWRALMSGALPRFQLFSDNGLLIDARGEPHVLMDEEDTYDLGDGIFIGRTEWSPYTAERLRTGNSEQRGDWEDPFSTWAERLAPVLITFLTESGPLPDPLGEGLTYLQNWNFSYDAASIGGSIFDTWMRRYLEETGRLPRAGDPPPDAAEKRLRLELFYQAMRQLTERYGTDLSRWRWETVQPDIRYFTPWTETEMQPGSAPPTFSPLSLPGSGHPSAPAWGTSPVLSTPVRFLDRYRIANERPSPLSLGVAKAEYVTRLLPR